MFDISEEKVDEDFTHISEENVPYLSLPIHAPSRAKSADSGERNYYHGSGRPQTAPSLEGGGSIIQYEESISPRLSSDVDDTSVISIQKVSSVSKGKKKTTDTGRRKVRQATSTSYRGRVELDLTESGSRFPLKPPVAKTVKLNSRPSPKNLPSPIEAFADNHVSFDVSCPEHENDIIDENDENEKIKYDVSPKPSLPMSQFLYNDPDNKKYSAQKKMNNLSEADQSALRLGRLVLSTVLNQPEISVPDAISRFFLDTWLAKNGSSISKADGLSVSLMTNLQRAFTEYDPGVDVGAKKAASCQKTIAAIACETLDTLIQAFGDSNPVLYDIRESLMPLIFMHPPELKLPLKKLTKESMAEETKLSGERYVNVDTWCEDGAVLVEALRETENALFMEQKKSNQASSDITSMYDQLEKLQYESKEALTLMYKARADTEQAESNYKKLSTNFDELSKKLAEEEKKFKAEHEKCSKEQKSAMVFNMKYTALKVKYDDLLKAKLELKETNLKLKSDISVLNENLTNSQNSFEASRRSIEIIKANAQETMTELEAERKHRQQCDQRDQGILKDMIDFFMSTENKHLHMSHQVRNMLTTPPQPVVIQALDAWKDELLVTVNNLEGQLKAAHEEIKQMDATNLNKLKEDNLNELKLLNAAHSKQILELKEQHRVDLAALEDTLKIARSDNLELTLERNSVESQLQDAEERLLELKGSFEDGNSLLAAEVKGLRTEKNLLWERLSALQEDYMLKEVLTEVKLTNSGLNEKVFYLVKSIENLTQELAGEKLKNSAVQAELDATGAELLDATNLVMERDNTIVGLYEEIELLRKPNAKEEKLMAEVKALKLELIDCRELNASLETQLATIEKEKHHWQREFERLSLLHEDWLAAQRVVNIRIADETFAQVTSLKNTIHKQFGEIESLSRRHLVSENELMREEDLFVRRLQMTNGLQEEKISLEKDVADGEEVKAMLMKNIKELTTYKERLLVHQQEAEESYAQLTIEHKKLQQKLQEIRITGMVVGYEKNSVKVSPQKSEVGKPQVSTDEKSTQTDVLEKNKTTSVPLSSGNQSTGKGIPPKIPTTHKKNTNSSTNVSRSKKVVSRSQSTAATARPNSSASMSSKQSIRRSDSASVESRSSTHDDNRSTGSSFSATKAVMSLKTNTRHSNSPPSASRDRDHGRDRDKKKKVVGPNTYERGDNDADSLGSHFSTASSHTGIGTHPMNVQLPSVITTSSSSKNLLPDEDLSDCESDAISIGSSTVKRQRSRSRSVQSVEGDDRSRHKNEDCNITTNHSRREGADQSKKGSMAPRRQSKSRINNDHIDEEDHNQCNSICDSISTFPINEQLSMYSTRDSPDDEQNSDDEHYNHKYGTEYDIGQGHDERQENEEEVDLTPEEMVDNLCEIDKNFSQLFDMTIAFKSSQGFLFDIIALREKRSLNRTARFKVLTREAKALVSRLEAKISQLSRSMLLTNNRIGEQDDLLQSMRADIADNRWIFELKNIEGLPQCPLKDAIEVGALLIQSAGVGDDLENLQAADAVVQDKGCAFGIKRLIAGVQEWKDRYDEKLHLHSGKRPYEAMIRLEDGSIDTDLELEVYTDIADRNYILLKMNEQLKKDKREMRQLLSDELQSLRDVIKAKERALEVATESNRLLQAELKAIHTSTAPLESYTTLRAALKDVIQFMSSLTTSNSTLSTSGPGNTLPAGSTHVRKLKSKVLEADLNPPGHVNIYGNPGLLWKKIQKHKQTEKASRILKGFRDPVPELSVTQPRKPIEPVPCPEPSSDDKLIRELSAVCNDLAEQVLFSTDASMTTATQFQASSSLLLAPDDLNDSQFHNESVVSNVEISPSLLEYSFNLNKNVNHHVEEIKRLKQRKATLLNENSNGDPSVQAERYYAAQNVFSSYSPDNINKWSQAFPHGSGSDNAQAIVHQGVNNASNTLPVRNTIRQPPASDGELPIIDRRQLVSSEAEAAGTLLQQPNKQFLSSYRNTLKDSDVPLLVKKVMK